MQVWSIFYNLTFNIADILHSDLSSIWGEKVLEMTWHMDQPSIHTVACETLRNTHKEPHMHSSDVLLVSNFPWLR